MNEQLSDEEMIRARNRARIAAMQKSKQRQMLFRKYFRIFAPATAGVVVIVLLLITGIKLFHKDAADYGKEAEKKEAVEEIEEKETKAETEMEMVSVQRAVNRQEKAESEGALAVKSGIEHLQEEGKHRIYSAEENEKTVQLGAFRQSGKELFSEYVVLVDLSDDSIAAKKNAFVRMNPASMTKILTVLVAAEHVENLDDTFTMTLEITDYGYVNDCSSAGFEKDERVTVRDLFYGTILPSGADAAVGLAAYVAGSQEAFVDMMNQKLKELGLSDTAHMTNCVGIYDENHYCTVYDMAMILEAAIDNELCREVLSAHTYTTSNTLQHPEGITVSNWFLRRIEDKDSGGEVICGKTGYVVQSGNCAASYGVDESGKGYICVTAGANSHWRCIEDHAGLYKQFSAGREGGEEGNDDT